MTSHMLHHGPQHVLDLNPSMFSRAGTSAAVPNAMGHALGGAVDLPMLGLDGSTGGPHMGSDQSRNVIGRTNWHDSGAQDSNGRTVVYHCPQAVDDWQEGDTADGLPTFALLPEARKAASGTKQAMPMLSMPQWNYRMKHDPEFRRRWGQELDASLILAEWRYMGYQINKQTDLNCTQRAWTTENNFAHTGRVIVHNLHLAAAGSFFIGEGMMLGFILLRHLYVADAAANASTWTARSPSSDADAIVTSGRVYDPEVDNDMAAATTRKRKRDDEDDLAALRATGGEDGTGKRQRWSLPRDFSATRLEGANKVAKATPIKLALPEIKAPSENQYYWQWHPWVCPRGTSIPDPAMYTHDPLTRDKHNRYIGASLNIGIVQCATKGLNQRTPDQVTQMREGLYPAVRGSDYLRAVRRGDKIEIQLAQRTGTSGN